MEVQYEDKIGKNCHDEAGPLARRSPCCSLGEVPPESSTLVMFMFCYLTPTANTLFVFGAVSLCPYVAINLCTALVARVV